MAQGVVKLPHLVRPLFLGQRRKHGVVVAGQGDDRTAQAIQGLAMAIHDPVDLPQAQGAQDHREREDHLDQAGPIGEIEAA